MAKPTASRPKPRKASPGAKAQSFQARVDYVAKALVRGSWGEKFDACFEHHDSNHLVAVVMQRAERNQGLRDAIMSSFGVDKWDDVPWVEVAAPFEGMSARKIGTLAAESRSEGEAAFAALYRDPELMMSSD